MILLFQTKHEMSNYFCTRAKRNVKILLGRLVLQKKIKQKVSKKQNGCKFAQKEWHSVFIQSREYVSVTMYGSAGAYFVGTSMSTLNSLVSSKNSTEDSSMYVRLSLTQNVNHKQEKRKKGKTMVCTTQTLQHRTTIASYVAVFGEV